MTATLERPSETRTESRPRIVVPGLLIGVGLGGFVDGVVLHQILQWHHMLTAHPDYDTFPNETVPALRDNTLADGIFHAASLILLAAGIFLLWRALDGRTMHEPLRSFVGLLLAGWGAFNLVEGVIDHQILTVHHVRDDVADSAPWDVGFLVVSALLLLGGWWLYRSGRDELRSTAAPSRSRRRSPRADRLG